MTVRVLKVGLTGGIGAGKSAVATSLVRLGAVLIDADALAREVVAPGTAGLREVVAAFGPEVLGPDGALDRPALGARVFGDEPARRTLEAIIHPRVRARTAELTAAAPADAIVVNDVPLLVETGLAVTYQLVIVVTADEATRVERLVRTRGMSRADAQARIRAQADDRRRLAEADALLINDGTPADLEASVERLWWDRLVPFEANLRAGRPATAPATAPVTPTPTAPATSAATAWPVAPATSGVAAGADVVNPDPAWPAQAARLIARVSAVAGDLLVRIDHVGSTAVPALPARDVIDIQAVVPDLDAAYRLATVAGAAGLVPVSRDTPGPADPASVPLPPGSSATAASPGWSEWGTPAPVALAGADPARPACIGLIPVSAPDWREILLVRDWLRADQAARDGYAAAKRELAARGGHDPIGYRRGVTAWLAMALPRARAWAIETGWSADPRPPDR